MDEKKENNYAFIDTQNILRVSERLGWIIDWYKFRIYLRNRFHVSKAFLCLGYIEKNQREYIDLVSMGYELAFKTVYEIDGKYKANVDVEVALMIMNEINNFDKAILVTNDGDFHSLISILKDKNKFKTCIAVTPEKCSVLLKKITAGNIVWISKLQSKISREMK